MIPAEAAIPFMTLRRSMLTNTPPFWPCLDRLMEPRGSDPSNRIQARKNIA